MAFPESLGIDFDCADDITDDLAFCDDPILAFAQACFRRLTMGQLFYAREYGPNLFAFMLETGATDAEISSAITAALTLDDRVASASVAFIGTEIRVSVRAHGNPTNVFTLAIDRVSGALLPLETT